MKKKKNLLARKENLLARLNFWWLRASGRRLMRRLFLGSTHQTGNVPLTFPEGYNSLQNKCWTADIDRQNLGRSGKLSFFIIYKFWQNCASVRQVSDLILKTVIIRLADNTLAYNVLLAFPERYDTTSSYSTSIGLWKFNSTGLILQ